MFHIFPSSFADTPPLFLITQVTEVLHQHQMDWTIPLHSTSFPLFVANAAHFSIPKTHSYLFRDNFYHLGKIINSIASATIQPKALTRNRWFVSLFLLPNEYPCFIFQNKSIIESHNKQQYTQWIIQKYKYLLYLIDSHLNCSCFFQKL